MKFNIIKILKLPALILFIIAAVILFHPLKVTNYSQAKLIADWKSDFEELKYCFDLVNTHEDGIIPKSYDEIEITSDMMFKRFSPYFNLMSENPGPIKKYKYRKLNGKSVKKDNQFYFDRFVITKTGMILSIIKNQNYKNNIKNSPMFYMFVDINGKGKPNVIGRDIFFINIYDDYIKPLGYGSGMSGLKINCSPVGSGIYCSQYYILGGRF